MGAVLEVDSAALRAKFQRMPQVVHRELQEALRDWGQDWQRTMVLRMKGGPPGVSAPDRLTQRTGALRSTFRYDVSGGTLPSLRLRLVAGGRGAPYARIHEYGGKIVPRRAGALTVPLRAALTPSGALSGKALIRKKPGGGYTTDFGDTFLLRRPGKDPLVVAKDGDKLHVLYVLKKSVTIPGPSSTGAESRLKARETASVKGPRGRYIVQRVGEALQRIAAS